MATGIDSAPGNCPGVDSPALDPIVEWLTDGLAEEGEGENMLERVADCGDGSSTTLPVAEESAAAERRGSRNRQSSEVAYLIITTDIPVQFCTQGRLVDNTFVHVVQIVLYLIFRE